MASSKLLLAAVKLCVQLAPYLKPRRQHTQAVMGKMVTKYTVNGAATRRTDVIERTTFAPCDAKSTVMVYSSPISDKGLT